MNTKPILLAISVAAFSSCTTLYKSGQTPDDVYYSPNRTYGETAREDRNDRNDRVESRRYSNEDAAIRMGIYDPRWRYLDNDYAYNPYSYGFNHGYYYNPYFWPYPVYSPIFSTPTNPKVTTPRMNNLGGYGSVPGYNNTAVNPKIGRGVPGRRSYNNSNNGTAVGNALRRVLGSDNNYSNSNNNSNNNNSSNNNRSYTPSNNSSNSSSGSRSSSSGSSGGGQISRPPRSGS